MTARFRGNFINGRFEAAHSGVFFSSENPASPGTALFDARAEENAVGRAVEAAIAAASQWRLLPLEKRVDHLLAVKAALPQHVDGIARAITLEMGKVIGEARAEAQSIAGKIDAVIRLLPSELPAAIEGAPGEQRFRPLGAVGIIGPFNYPIHLLNTHIVPALLTGNTVVVKPSEVTPLTGQRYAELFQDAGLPAGVFNLVHGLGRSGATLAAHPALKCVVFTGSYRTGRLIRQALFEQPWKKLCLELGGKNAAVVLDDADLEQAVREITLGALLTTGQRCTATSRVIATQGIADALRERLVAVFQKVIPGNPQDEATFMGPLADQSAYDRFLQQLGSAKRRGVVELLPCDTPSGGYFVTPAISEVKGDEEIVNLELFGPHICFEACSDEEDALKRAAANPYGLSVSLFSARPEAFERFYDAVPAGVYNFNRSTNGASGLLPFGGVGRSGNFNPTGSASPRLCTYPAAVMGGVLGTLTAHAQLDALLEEAP
jgi:succinylglutamic semialdehyde dehydrogenase